MAKIKFGTILRASRLRFAYLARLDCFVRISDHGENFLVELRPNHISHLDTGKKKLYRVIDDLEQLFALSPVLSAIEEVSVPHDLILSERGDYATRPGF